MGVEGFSCNLKKYRLLKDMTQEQLAAAVGVRRETIMRLEKAQYNPSLKLAIDISRAVGNAYRAHPAPALCRSPGPKPRCNGPAEAAQTPHKPFAIRTCGPHTCQALRKKIQPFPPAAHPPSVQATSPVPSYTCQYFP